MATKKTREELESEVHGTEDSLIKAAATRWTVENMGQSWPEVRSVHQLLELHASGAEEGSEDELYEGIQAEYKDWRIEAEGHLRELERRGLPWTLANMELSFEKKLPGQKKAG